jgi:hypothetical protein
MGRSRIEAWADVASCVPDELRPYMLDFGWERERLWALDLSVIRVPTSELAWLLGSPLWRLDGCPFRLRPRDVLIDPTRYPDHAARTQNADLNYPIDIARLGARRVVLDGVHRLLKAESLGLRNVSVREVPHRAFASIAAG